MNPVVRGIVPGVLVVLFGFAPLGSVRGQQSTPGQAECSRPLPDPITTVAIPAGQRNLTMTRDGCWAFIGFVQRPESPAGFGVYQRSGDTYKETRFIPITPGNVNVGFGLAVTHDQKILIVSHARQIVFFDVAKLTAGMDDARLGEIKGERIGASWGVEISPDDKYAYVAQAQFASVVIIDLESGRASGFAPSSLVGVIPMTSRPSSATLSPDGKYLYSANAQAPDVMAPTLSCLGGKGAEGSISIIDVQKAKVAPQTATVGWAAPAGCSPSIVTVSADGNRLYTVAGGDIMNQTIPIADSSLVVFDTRPLGEGRSPTLVARIPVARAPNSIVDSGSRLFIGHLTPARITVVDPTKLALGQQAIIGALPINATGLMLMPDRRTMMGLASEALVVIDLDRVKPEPITRPPSRYDSTQDCTGALKAPRTDSQTFGVVLQPLVTQNGCWMFHVVADAVGAPTPTGITLRRRTGDTWESVRNIPLPIPRSTGDGILFGLALTSDQKTLIVSHGRQLTFLDVDAFIGQNDPILGRIDGASLATSAGVALTPGDRFLFVAQATGSHVAVIDVQKARASGFKDLSLLKPIPTAGGPMHLVSSPDGKYVYVASRNLADASGDSRPCAGGKEAEGVVQVIDVQRATADPSSAASAPVRVGCAPQYLALSPDGRRLTVAYGTLEPTLVTDNALVIFDTGNGQQLRETGRIPMRALPGRIVDTGDRLFVNQVTSLRAPLTGLPPLVIDPSKASSGKAAIVGQLASPSVALTLWGKGRILYSSVPRTLSVLDVGRLPVTPVQD